MASNWIGSPTALPLVALPFAACRALHAHTVCLTPLCMGSKLLLNMVFVADRAETLLLSYNFPNFLCHPGQRSLVEAVAEGFLGKC